MFNYLVIDLRDPVVPYNTLGVEVTDGAAAALCSLGNIDPQHGFGSQGRYALSAVEQNGSAACDAALTWPLPPGGATLATVRPDLDSVTAMAVLSLRAAGWRTIADHQDVGSYYWEGDDDLLAATRRITEVAKADGFIQPGTWRPRPLPTAEQPWGDGAVEDRRELAAVNAIAMDRDIGLEFRVAAVAAWILGGEDATEEHRDLAARAVGHGDECGMYAALGNWIPRLVHARARVEVARMDMIAALSPRPFVPYPMDSVDRAHAAAGVMSPPRMTVEERQGIAIVKGSHPGAMGLGYCVAPVVVALNPEHRWPSGATSKKATVGFFRSPGADVMKRIADALNRHEAAELCDQVDMTATSASYYPGPFCREETSVAHLARDGRVAEAIQLVDNEIAAAAQNSGAGYDGVNREWFLAAAMRVKALLGGAGWGGNYASGILGSPQGVDTVLSAEQIAAVVRAEVAS